MQYALHCLVAAAGLVGAIIGYNLPFPDDSRRYDLVQVHGDESDIIDYDQTAMDCGFRLEAMRRAGMAGFCEVTR